MKKIVAFIILVVFHTVVTGQEIPTNAVIQNQEISGYQSQEIPDALDNLLKEIAANNNRLKALRELSEAQKVNNKTGLNPENPQVEFNYLWGNQPLPGNRKDLRILQTFDFPTSYKYRSDIASIRNKQSDYEYKKEYLSVMYSARLLYIELVYLNAYMKELIHRTEDSRKLALAYESKLKTGDANILEYNKAYLNLANQQKSLTELNSNIRNVNSELTALNGGTSITIADDEQYIPLIETDFEKWYSSVRSSNPEIQWMEEESLINTKMVKLNSSLSLPKITAGYMSENLPDERFNGITVGMSIPLWENRNVVKSSKLKSIASQNLAIDLQQQFYFRSKSAHEKVINLLQIAKAYRTEVESHTNADFLKKAFDAGEISLIEYLTELAFYYDTIDQLLSMEREAGIAAATLLYYQE